MNIRKFITSAKIKPFDIAVTAVVFFLGVVFFLFFYRKAEYISIRVKVTDQEVLYQHSEPQTWYANRFQVGDEELDSFGRPITEVTGVETFNTDSQHKVVYLDLKVRAVYDTRTKLYSVRGKSIVFGTPMHFSLSKAIVDGFVTEFPGSENQKDLKVGTASVKALGRDVEPLLANALKKGDQVYDSNGVLLAEIKDIQITPAEAITQTDQGDLLLRYSPVFKDILLTLEVRTKTVHNETFMFDNLPLKVNEVVPLNFKKISIFPTITEFTLL